MSRSEQSGAQKSRILPLVLRVLSGSSMGGPIGALQNSGQDSVFFYSLKSKKIYMRSTESPVGISLLKTMTNHGGGDGGGSSAS